MKNIETIRLLFAANIISGLAQGITMVAIPWYFVKIVNSPEKFTTAYLIITFSTLFWGLYAGTLIDKYSRKRIFIIVNVICGLLIGCISIYGFFTTYLLDILVILVFAITIFNYNIHYPNLYAFGQEITASKDYGKLNSYIEVQGQVTSVLAGAFAAILLTGVPSGELDIAGIKFQLPFSINAWKIHEIFLLDAITYLFVIFLFFIMKYKRISKENKHSGALLLRFRQGINYLRDNLEIFIFGVVSYMLFAFTLVEIHIILPSYVYDFLKQDGNVYASAEIYYSFGAILAGIFVLRVFKNLTIFMSIIILMILVSVVLFFMTFYDFLWLFFLGNLIIGITNAGIRILRTTYLLNNIPNNLIGRATSVFGSLNICVRMILISLLAIPFFNLDENIRYGYLLGVGLMFFSFLTLFILYIKSLKNK